MSASISNASSLAKLINKSAIDTSSVHLDTPKKFALFSTKRACTISSAPPDKSIPTLNKSSITFNTFTSSISDNSIPMNCPIAACEFGSCNNFSSSSSFIIYNNSSLSSKCSSPFSAASTLLSNSLSIVSCLVSVTFTIVL